MVWYSDFGNQFAGVIDPKTGKATDIPIPVLQAGAAEGLARHRARSEGQPLAGDDVSGGHRQDRPQDPRGHSLSVPEGMAVGPRRRRRWCRRSIPTSTARCGPTIRKCTPPIALDIKTGEFENLGAVQGPARQADQRLRHADRRAEQSLSAPVRRRADRPASTPRPRRSTIYQTPTADSKPRRGRVDAQNRLWFAEYGGNAHRHVRSRRPRPSGMQAADAVERCPMTWCPTKDGRGVDRLDADRSGVAPRRQERASSPTTCCRGRPTSAASSCRRPDRGRCSGSAATTAPRSSRSSRWTELKPRRKALRFDASSHAGRGVFLYAHFGGQAR